MAISAEELETLLKESFPNGKVTITDLAGDGNHYAAEVIDDSFRGLNRVQQQRAVYAALKGKNGWQPWRIARTGPDHQSPRLNSPTEPPA